MKLVRQDTALSAYRRTGSDMPLVQECAKNDPGRLLTLWSIIILGLTLTFPSIAQINYYHNETFSIFGPASVCADGTTPYTYSGVIDNLTWSVTGGEFVGPNTGMSVIVKWSGSTLSLSAEGVGTSCYYDIEYSPPVMFCDITTYTSNAFSASSPIAIYSLIAGPYYSGTSGAAITLSGSQTSVNYQLKINGAPAGSSVAGTGNSIPWINQTAFGPYTVTATKASPTCTVTFPSSVTVEMQTAPPVITPANPPAISYGESVQLSVIGTYYSYQWYRYGVSIPDAVGQQFTTYEPGAYTVQVKETETSTPVSSTAVVINSTAVPTTHTNSKIVDDEVITANVGTRTYIIGKRLILSPGSPPLVFAASASVSYVFRMANPTQQAVPPSLDQNFVRTETVLVPGIKLEAAMMNLPVSQKNVVFDYSDGLGRSSQTVAVQSSPGLADVVQPYKYAPDDGQRTEEQYLPFTFSSQKGAFRTNALVSELDNFYNTSPKVNHDTKRNSKTTFEKSVLNRVTESYGPGSAWTTNSKRLTTAFSPAGPTIPRWQINSSTSLPYSAGNYTENVLYKSNGTDENGNQYAAYTDMRGLTIRTEQDNLVTINVYDDVGNLRYILPPKISSNAAPDQTTLDNWAFQYKYNERQLLKQQKGPGTDWVYYVYDQWDRLVAMQDGKQRDKSPASSREWTFTKYDEFNRSVITGTITSSLDYDAMVLAVSGAHHESKTTSTSFGYTLTSTFPSPSAFPSVVENNLLSINYYDDYGFLLATNWDAESGNYSFSNPPGFSNTSLNSVKGQMTGSKTRILGSSAWLNAVIYYDNKYRPIQAIQENHLAGVDRATFEYNFPGWTTKSHRSHNTSLGSATILEEFEYDHVGRLMKAWHTLDGGTRTLQASNSYNELGQLVEANLHSTNGGTSYLQSVDYRYNIRGWLTHINNSSLTDDSATGNTNDDTNDLFGMQLVYNEETPVVNGANTVAPQFNGNISAIKWKADNKKDTPKERIYGYIYDAKDRMTKSFFAANTGTAWTDEGGLYDEDNLTYDEHGNIKTLRRKGKVAGATGTLDDLNYNANGTTTTNNQLLTVGDAGNPSLGFVNGANESIPEYAFDKNGNMVYDLNNAVTEVKYNYLNLPEKVTINGGTGSETSVEFTYDASGYLLRKIYKKGTTEESRVDYVNGIQYYNSTLAQIFTSHGRATKYNGSWEYEYFMTDHQGNTRLVFGYLHDADVYKATMESYYSSQEEATFKKIAATRYTDVSPFTYNHTPRSTDVPVPDKSARLNGSVPGLEVGPGKMINIIAGDKLRMEVYGRYNPGSGNASDVVASLVSAATTSLNVTAGENPAAYAGFNTYLPGFVDAITYNTGEPKAYINYIFFDASYANPQFGYQVIPASAATKWEKLSISITAPYAGYAFIYLTNESNYNVFFDDFLIVHEKTTSSLRVTESADFYPFGLVIEGTRFVDESRVVNSYGYQGMFSEFDARTGWNRFELRGNYDSRLGRWQSRDPAGQYASPYLGMGNAGINGVDPDGAIFGLPPVLSGMLIGGAAGTAFGLAYDPKNWYLYTLGGIGAGALGGAIYQALIPTYSLNMIGKINPKIPKTPPLSTPGTSTPFGLNPSIPTLKQMSAALGGPEAEVIYAQLTYQGNSQRPNTGTLTMNEIWSNGTRETTVYSANSGTAIKHRPIPEAEDWSVSNYRDRSVIGTRSYHGGMNRDGVGFSFDITPDPRFGRDALRIHADGGDPGSEGCISLTCDAESLRDFVDRMQRYLRYHRQIRLRVRGTYNPMQTQINRGN